MWSRPRNEKDFSEGSNNPRRDGGIARVKREEGGKAVLMNGVVAAWRRFNNDPVEFAGLADRGPQQKKRKRYKEREGRGITYV